MKTNLKNKRIASLDVHSPLYLASSNNHFGGGDIDDLYLLIDKASIAGFSLVQLTPIQDTGENPSPYMGLSIFSLNPAFMSVTRIPQTQKIKHLIAQRQEEAQSEPRMWVRYRNIHKFKQSIIKASFENINKDEVDLKTTDKNVLAYAVFVALKKKFKRKWTNWPDIAKYSAPRDIIKIYPDIIDDVKLVVYGQRILLSQWKDLSGYAQSKGITLMLDKPIYPVHDSADVWANKKLFYLQSDGELQYLSGCDNPRDPFGMQIWGHAVYKFQESSDEATDYLKESVAFMSQISEAIRLDHVLALIWKYFIIAPKSDKGKHIMALGKKLFKALTENFPNVFFVAEDVGYINTKAIDKPLGGFSIPGVRCPAWANRIKYSQIYNYPENCLATTSLHDLDCIARWWANLDKSDRKKYTQQVRKYKKSKGAPFSKTSLTDVIEIIFASRANIASITLRDLVGDLRRYNTPGTQNLKNWRARSPQDIEDINFGPIEEIIRKTNRFL